MVLHIPLTSLSPLDDIWETLLNTAMNYKRNFDVTLKMNFTFL